MATATRRPISWCRARAGSSICGSNSEWRASSLLLTQLRICLPLHDSGTAHTQGRTGIAGREADMQLCQQQRAFHGVRRGAPPRTRLAKGMRGSSPHKAYTPDQLFVHALRGGDGPCDARTLVSVIAAPTRGSGCQGQRQPLRDHLRVVALTASRCMSVREGDFLTGLEQPTETHSSMALRTLY